MQEMLVDVNIDGSRHEGVGKGQSHSFVKLKALFADGFSDEGESGDEGLGLAAFESGRNGVDGVEDDVGKPAEEGGGHCGYPCVGCSIPGLKEFYVIVTIIFK